MTDRVQRGWGDPETEHHLQTSPRHASSNRVCICGAPMREGDWFRREVNKSDECSHAIPNSAAEGVKPGTFGPVFDAGVEEGKWQARHATPNRVLELEDDEEQRIVVGALEQYADTKRYTVAASTADRKMLDRQGAIAKSLAQRLT